MANHGFITTKKNLKKDNILLDLHEINQRRFKSSLSIEETNWSGRGAWYISYKVPGQDYREGFHIWLTSSRKIEHRHAHNFAAYLETSFTEELGVKYNATMSDEGISDKWKPDPEKYKTYKLYYNEIYGGAHAIPGFFEKLLKNTLSHVPKELRDC
ncbi:hypothetical protein UFOVP1290_339 [uncultured Caudovirales phage]|uniref:Uncharacterized protein n=1 Tax=uncultured Caudovirales phage TaxID=2100421 RepID=A0A6J5RIK5_9CAUD|nr:hypothetical protein UFOVP1290_339 [uncultured Caudovirales phage]